MATKKTAVRKTAVRKRIRRAAPSSGSRITYVVFRSNIELGPFQHSHVEAGAEVGPNDNPSKVLDSVKDFVAAELLRAKHGDRVPADVRQPFRARLGPNPTTVRRRPFQEEEDDLPY